MAGYLYYDVIPKGMKKTYSYLADFELESEALVLIPFGKENNLIGGKITGKDWYEEDEAPYPPENTKKIIRALTVEEYKEADGFIYPWGSDDYDILSDARELEKYYDIEEMLSWAFRYAYRHDSAEIMDVVGRFYRAGIKEGNASAAFALAGMYENGVYYEKDGAKAIELYQYAANRGNAGAVCKLGLCCYDGYLLPQDDKMAYRYFDRAALLYNNAVALYMLGDMYYNGRYVEKDLSAAVELYKRSMEIAREEHKTVLPDIRLRLGKIYMDRDFDAFNPLGAIDYLCDALRGFDMNRYRDNEIPDLIMETKELILRAANLLQATP